METCVKLIEESVVEVTENGRMDPGFSFIYQWMLAALRASGAARKRLVRLITTQNETLRVPPRSLQLRCPHFLKKFREQSQFGEKKSRKSVSDSLIV